MMDSQPKHKVAIAMAFALLAFAMASAQSPDLFFEEQFPYHSLGNPPVSIFADKPYCYVTEVAPAGESEGYCLMTVNHDRICSNYETQSVSQPLVYKVSMRGESLGKLALGYDDRYALVHGLYQAHDDQQEFLAVGKLHDNDLHYDRPFMARFDQDLNLVWQREIELPEAYHNNISFGSVMDSEGNIFCSSYLYDCEGGSSFSRFYFRLTSEGELDGIREFPYQTYFQNVFEYSDGSGDYGLLEEVREEDLSVLWRINRNLETVGQLTLPSRYVEMDPTNTYPSLTFMLPPPQWSTSGRHAMAVLSDGSLIMANEADIIYQDIYQGIHDVCHGIGFLKVSLDGEAVSCAMGEETTAHDSLWMIVPKLPMNDDSFYFVYMKGENFGYDYMNCFIVGRMDFEGNLIWRRYWNRYLPEYGMKIYYPQDAAITHDNGCIVTGFSFNSDINSTGNYTYEPDVFLLKFFADGSFDNASELDSQIRPFAFWPNPADERLSLEFSPDVNPVKLEFYDLNGRLLITQNDRFGSMDLSGLPAGLYTLRVTLSDGITYSDKVVKQ